MQKISLSEKELREAIMSVLGEWRWSDEEDEMSSDIAKYGNHNVKDGHGKYSMRAQSNNPIDKRMGRSMRTTGKETFDALDKYNEAIGRLTDEDYQRIMGNVARRIVKEGIIR